jgi:hypothetical protein
LGSEVRRRPAFGRPTHLGQVPRWDGIGRLSD